MVRFDWRSQVTAHFEVQQTSHSSLVHGLLDPVRLALAVGLAVGAQVGVRQVGADGHRLGALAVLVAARFLRA